MLHNFFLELNVANEKEWFNILCYKIMTYNVLFQNFGQILTKLNLKMTFLKIINILISIVIF